MPKNYNIKFISKKNKKLAPFLVYNPGVSMYKSALQFDSKLSGLNVLLHDGKVWKEVSLPVLKTASHPTKLYLNFFRATKPVGYLLEKLKKKNKKKKK